MDKLHVVAIDHYTLGFKWWVIPPFLLYTATTCIPCGCLRTGYY